MAMNRNLLSIGLKGIISFLILSSSIVSAQNKLIVGEELESFTNHILHGLDQVKKVTGANDYDFEVFERFYENKISNEKGKLYSEVESRQITLAEMPSYEKKFVKEYTELYKKFQTIKKEYPSSVAEYSSYIPPNPQTNSCDSACTNPDFMNGTLDGWNAYYANNSSYALTYFNITGLTGGACGPVQKAALDPLTYNSYQVMIMNGGNDPIVPSVPRVSPYSSSPYSVRIGDSIGVNYGVAILEQTFHVTAATSNFTYQYAIFLQNPPGHTYYEQPFFNAVVLDSVGDTIPNCGKYVVISGHGTGPNSGWDSVKYNGEKLFYKNWTTVFTSLHNYVGHCVTVRFTCSDCALGGHFGYAYVTASCAPSKVLSSSPAFCGQKTITLTGPPGGVTYQWTGPTGGIVGSDSSQNCTVDSSGTYQLVVEPVTGAACNDTLTITVPKAPGPPPIPSFVADTICAGQATQFVNTSNPLSGPNVKFYWDFFNNGMIEDSTTNPLFTFNTPGTYTVKLNEVNNGCGADTLIKIKVDSTVSGAFNVSSACVKQSVYFTNTTVGGTSFKWNFGDPSSGASDSSSLQNPSHTFDTAGSYKITMIAGNGGPCPDTVSETISIVPPPVPSITGNDSVCLGNSTTLTANAPGATSYVWSYPSGSLTCPTCAVTSVTPTVTTTYTVTASNGLCSGDTTFTVYVKPVPSPTIATMPKDTICIGDSTMLVAWGGCTYSWTNTGQTSDSIWIHPNTTTTYSLQVTCNGCTASTTKKVSVIVPGQDSVRIVRDSICPNDTTTIVAYGGTSYKWLPPLSSTNSKVIVSSPSNATYSVVIMNQCIDDTLTMTLHIAPVPKLSLSGDTSICIGNSTSLIASGGTKYSWSNGSTSGTITVTPSKTTTYTVTVSNGRCSSDSTITVYVHNPPIVGITPPNSICPGGSITLTASGGGTYKWSTGSTSSSITVTPKSTTTYSVLVTNICNASDSTVITVDEPVLDACCDTTITLGGSADLKGVGQTNYSWIPTDGLSCFTCPNPVATPTTTTTYTVTSTDSNGCTVSRTVTVIVEIPCADFVVPNVFTPNDDGRNDDFVINVLNPSGYSITIYDRWGKIVYTSTDSKKYWNGRIKNTDYLVPDGVYYYIIKATCADNNYVKKGFVHVMGEAK